jgi:predicted nucleotidyltransferase
VTLLPYYTAALPRRGPPGREEDLLDRETIIERLAGALEPLDYVLAFWEGGSAAFGRSDQWSDIDLYIDADDGRAQDVLAAVEQALEALSPIDLKYVAPTPPGGDYVHVFYRLKGAGKYLLVDIAVIKHSSPEKFLEPEVHGKSIFIFNKGNAVTCPALDRAKLAVDIKAALAETRVRFDMAACFVLKELERGNYIEALDLYARLVLGPLVQALRIKHDPARYNFGPHYMRYNLPPDVVAKLMDLYFVRDPDDLREKYARAETWFCSVVGELKA